jgi:hypothetical protein
VRFRSDPFDQRRRKPRLPDPGLARQQHYLTRGRLRPPPPQAVNRSGINALIGNCAGKLHLL